MRVDLISISDVKVVNKPWGQEKWLQAGNEVYPFALKELILKGGQRTSLQVHKFKSETIYILSGKGILLTHPDFFDCDLQRSPEEIENIIKELVQIDLNPGDVFHTPPGTVHRMIALSDLLYIEASTTQLDDVVRLQDDNNRKHGRIESEHK